ncbi:hypothetical protein [Cyanothece sp. BG0011]|nr:hypothetical protein [Cyanothece sp. BG0011]
MKFVKVSRIFIKILFRFDDVKEEIYILAGKDIEVIIYLNGDWEFLPNET